VFWRRGGGRLGVSLEVASLRSVFTTFNNAAGTSILLVPLYSRPGGGSVKSDWLPCAVRVEIASVFMV